MLIAIGVIALLLAILAPLIVRVEANRQRLACAANLHHLGVAAPKYALDHSRALPTHFGGGTIPFDTFWMRQTGGEFVNLGLLLEYVDAPETFYCVSHDRRTSPSIAFNTPQNRWRREGPPGPPERRPKRHDPPEGVNSSYPARFRDGREPNLPRWSMLNFTDNVIYSDFVSVDNWPGSGRFRASIQAPHKSEGYNRLFGDGSVAWVDADPIHALRPVDAHIPTGKQLSEYYKLLDVLP